MSVAKPLRRYAARIMGDPQAGRVVPPAGHTARLTVFTSAAMAFLAVFALALSLAAGRVADRWSDELARTATLRISAPADRIEAQTRAALELLQTTPGIKTVHALTQEEQTALLEPWFGTGLALDQLPVPQLIEIVQTQAGFDAVGLRARLQAEVPGAVLDDHSQWRRPLVRAASGLRALGWAAIGLIGAASAAMITLAASVALAANAQVIAVLRLVGAHDDYIAGAFVRRFVLRALGGAGGGTLLGMVAIALLPDTSGSGGFLTGLAFEGAGWIWPLLIAPLAGMIAYVATRAAALRTLRRMP